MSDLIHDEISRRYKNDPAFAHLVNSLRATMRDVPFSTTDMVAAVDLAYELNLRDKLDEAWSQQFGPFVVEKAKGGGA